jgi:hypothetical protein
MIVNEFLPDLSLAKNSREDSDDDAQESHSELKRTEGLGFKKNKTVLLSARRSRGRRSSAISMSMSMCIGSLAIVAHNRGLSSSFVVEAFDAIPTRTDLDSFVTACLTDANSGQVFPFVNQTGECTG